MIFFFLYDVRNGPVQIMQQQITPKKIESVVTEDGSITGHRKDLGVHYRSIFGAKTEVKYIFLERSRIIERSGRWCIGELGFGLGYTFALTVTEAILKGCELDYYSLDMHPAPPESIPKGTPHRDLIQTALHEVRSSGNPIDFREGNIRLRLIPKRWQETPPTERFDAIFHDPFSPKDNPDCWTNECFDWWFKQANQDAILATYSAAGHVRRALNESGFWVATTKGPGRKREITLACRSAKPLSKFEHLKKHAPK
jgi:tRNA U34 5-methylaminomethyl-2-thiouridine-forming methyltransferase MnmC